jgi:hypothetical protein
MANGPRSGDILVSHATPDPSGRRGRGSSFHPRRQTPCRASDSIHGRRFVPLRLRFRPGSGALPLRLGAGPFFRRVLRLPMCAEPRGAGLDAVVQVVLEHRGPAPDLGVSFNGSWPRFGGAPTDEVLFPVLPYTHHDPGHTALNFSFSRRPGPRRLERNRAGERMPGVHPRAGRGPRDPRPARQRTLPRVHRGRRRGRAGEIRVSGRQRFAAPGAAGGTVTRTRRASTALRGRPSASGLRNHE